MPMKEQGGAQPLGKQPSGGSTGARPSGQGDPHHLPLSASGQTRSTGADNAPAPPSATSSLAIESTKRGVDLDLSLTDFHERFLFGNADDDESRTVMLAAAERLLDLLFDTATCEARIAILEQLTSSAAGKELLPKGIPYDHRGFVRELYWISIGRLPEAVAAGKALGNQLAQFASNADSLRMARCVLLEGPDAIAPLIRQIQVEAWNWLRDEVSSGRLVRFENGKMAGKQVAIWRAEQPYAEFEVGIDPMDVRERAAVRWMVPESLIAVTYVDAD